MKAPCEYIIWHILPSIRKEFARSLMRNYSLNQKQSAEKLGLTDAAVCQYLSDKRGGIEITDENILVEIDKSAKIIFENGSEKIVGETCRICNLLISKELVAIPRSYDKNMKISCESAMWYILPAVRKEFAKSLIEDHGLTQRKAADVLGITEAAVSRYVSGKRGDLEIPDDKMLKEIKESSNRIVEGNGKTVMEETCRICGLIKSKSIVSNLYKAHYDKLILKHLCK